MIKFIFKWLLRLFILAVVLLIVALLSYNTILRLVIEHNIRAKTGMDAEIGRFHLALTEPTIEISDLKIYNTKEFGGAPFLNIPEVHVEYDRDALLKQKIHITLLRFNLGELDIVKNQSGLTNIFSLGMSVPTNAVAVQPSINFKKETGYDFSGIDTLNVSIGKLRYMDLQNPKNNREQEIGIDNCVMKNVKTTTDLNGLAVLVALHSGSFFLDLTGQNKSSSSLLKQLGF